MSKKTHANIAMGLQEAIAYVQSDKKAVARVVAVKSVEIKTFC
jgi:hypothetical protein